MTEAGIAPFAGLLTGLRLALGTGDREADREALSAVSDWNAVASLARRHGVAFLLLNGMPAGMAEASDAESALAPLRRRAIMRGLRQLADLREAADRLDANGIPFLVLKGLPLSARLFGTPLARNCIDIDLLVPPDAVSSAAGALSSGGWRLVKPSFRPTPARLRCYDRFVQHRVFAGPGGWLELHHRLTSNPFLLEASFDRLRANAATIEIGGRAFAVLGDDDLLIHLAVHGQVHRWSRLKWLCDVAALLALTGGRGFDAAVRQCRRRNLELEPTFGAALLLCRELLHIELPAPAASLSPGAQARRTARTAREIWNRPGGIWDLPRAGRRLDEIRTVHAMKPTWRILAQELMRLAATPAISAG